MDTKEKKAKLRQFQLKALDRMTEITGLSYSALAVKAKIASSTINRFVGNNPDYVLSSPTLESLAEACGFDSYADFLLNGYSLQYQQGNPVNDDFCYIRVLDISASAGGGALVQSEPVKYAACFRNDWLRGITMTPPEELWLIHVSGDSMEPTLADKDIVLVDTRVNRVRQDGIYVLRYDDALCVKRIRINHVMKTITVVSDNPYYPPYEALPTDITILGKVVWLGRKV